MNQITFAKDDIVVANEFNSFCSSVGQTAISNIKSLTEECNYDLSQSEFKPTSHPESEQFMFETVDCEEIREIVSSMPTNKSPGIDQISMRVIEDSLPAVLPTIIMENWNNITLENGCNHTNSESKQQQTHLAFANFI